MAGAKHMDSRVIGSDCLSVSPLKVRPLGRIVWMGVARKQSLQERQRTAVHGTRIEEPLDLQAIGRRDHQGRRIHRVNVRRDAADPLPGLNPDGKRLPQLLEPVAHELPGYGVPFLQRIDGEGRVELTRPGIERFRSATMTIAPTADLSSRTVPPTISAS